MYRQKCSPRLASPRLASPRLASPCLVKLLFLPPGDRWNKDELGKERIINQLQKELNHFSEYAETAEQELENMDELMQDAGKGLWKDCG